ncbi:N(4)-(Beta-N-acetylglucosaminyl)-L-asparaginase-like [Saccostrea echinata]|uniref:N(4)-(Beta-N-acetylglucosaminyl)-L-asparaginase- like n=1 Tax=Saccostrea echinata TaxID=191078 RepID=UPI002A80E1E5|nr:N(4)-(Beta-N-acetylglucosaminyl)-L-asparaginase-like [Saccostrea echinata]
MAAPIRSLLFYFVLSIFCRFKAISTLPIVVNTWPFTNATETGYNVFLTGGSAVDAVERGCSKCEVQRCDGSVGEGSDPDEEGEVTLDAMIMDGESMDVGSVGCLRNISSAISVARMVMERTDHTLLAGELATKFAVEMGFTESDLSSNKSDTMYKQWKTNNCQPNYRVNVNPDPKRSCGPYHPNTNIYRKETREDKGIGYLNHDTIGMVAVDKNGHVVSGTTTNGLNHKIPGRVGDSPIVGAGSYAQNGMGGAAATGDGDIMMRFLPSYTAVQLMGSGMSPSNAALSSIKPIIKYFPDFDGAVIAVNHKGEHGAACHGAGIGTFHYSVMDNPSKVNLFSVKCV